MVTCIDENQALRYVDGLLPPAVEEEVEAHAARCSECRWLINAAGRAVHDEGSAEIVTQQMRRPSMDDVGARDALVRRIGEVLADTYVIERYIGRGGMGTVYEAVHRRLPRRFAIKLLSASLAGDSVAIARIRREAEVTSRLSHPHIVAVVDFNYAEDGTPFIAMELLEGESLATRIRQRGPCEDLQEVADIMRQITSALGAAHRAGVIHRDLKPGNIFLCPTGRAGVLVKVMDFGLSKLERGPVRARADSRLTQLSAILGTPAYMPPEQASGASSAADRRSDIFSLGATLYEMLAGRPPFPRSMEGPGRLLVPGQRVADDLATAGVPAAVRQVINRAMSTDLKERHNSMEELWGELAAALGATDVSSDVDRAAAAGSPSSPLLRTLRGTERQRSARRPWAWVGALVLLASGVAGLGFSLSGERAPGSGPGRGQPQERASKPSDPARARASSPYSERGRGETSAEKRASRPHSSAHQAARLHPALFREPRRGRSPGTREPSPPPREPSLSSREPPRKQRASVEHSPGERRRARSRPARHARMRPRPAAGVGTLVVQSRSKRDGRYLWADVYLDGSKVGQTALVEEGVAEGRHRLELRRGGYRTVAREVSVAPGRRTRVTVEMEPVAPD